MARRKNLSVQQFQDLMKNIPPAVGKQLQAPVRDAALELANAIAFAAPRGKDPVRELQQSVRAEQGRHPLRYLVRAGGPLTTKGGYDYAMAQEFGTQKQPAQPFFYSTFRAKKRGLRSKITKGAKKAISNVVKISG